MKIPELISDMIIIPIMNALSSDDSVLGTLRHRLLCMKRRRKEDLVFIAEVNAVSSDDYIQMGDNTRATIIIFKSYYNLCNT